LKVNANSHLIDNEKEIDPSLLQNVKSIGVCGATSTPKWLMEKIYNHIRTLIKE
ncbi:4-hydroxy-3-methylbut-2-enyl diphosphate reductase, partial [Bacteroides ovatus]